MILTPLFELRYFNIPWVLLALEINGLRPREKGERIVLGNLDVKWHVLNVIGFMVINAGVMFVFIKKPFYNQYFNGELSRFFW